MTDRIGGNHRTTTRLRDVIRWNNIAGGTIPAHGVVQFRTDYATGYSQASKPDSTEGLFFVNGPVDIASGEKGESLLWNQPRVVLLGAGVQVGDQVGPTADSWEMVVGGSGFRVIHQPVGGVGTVVQVGGGSVELSHGIVLEVCNVGCSTYRVQRVHRYLSPNCDDESGSGS